MADGVFQTFTGGQGYGNNRCSGHALAPILIEIDKSRIRSVIGGGTVVLGNCIYEYLCTCQRRLLAECARQSASIRFVDSPINIAGETCMILPSAIVHYCSSLGLSPTLFYSSERKSIFQTEVFKEDCDRMKKYLCLVDGYDEFRWQARKYRYLLALTRFQHWVALKWTEGGYYLFDPAPKELGGGVFGPGAFDVILPEISKKYNSKYFYDILIGLCPIGNKDSIS